MSMFRDHRLLRPNRTVQDSLHSFSMYVKILSVCAPKLSGWLLRHVGIDEVFTQITIA